MTTWISDESGNRASVEYWGSEQAARAALATNEECRNCDNCSGCSGCSDCSDCSDCSGCSRCSYCSGCSDCSDCSGCSRCSDCSGCSRVEDVVDPIVTGPVRSDGYQFVMGASRSIHAGCRVMISLAEAREHWSKTRGGTKLGDETMLILDYLERAAALKAAA